MQSHLVKFKKGDKWYVRNTETNKVYGPIQEVNFNLDEGQDKKDKPEKK